MVISALSAIMSDRPTNQQADMNYTSVDNEKIGAFHRHDKTICCPVVQKNECLRKQEV